MSRKKPDSSLFFRLVEVVWGAICVALGFALANGVVESYTSADAAWIYLTISTLAVFMLIWGFILIARGVFPGNRLLDKIVGEDSFAGSNEAGCLSIILAAPLHLLLRVLRRDNRTD